MIENQDDKQTQISSQSQGYGVGNVYGQFRKGMTEKTNTMKEAFNRGTDKLYHVITSNDKIVRFRIGMDGKLILENTVKSINLHRNKIINAGKEVPVRAQKQMRQAITGDPNKRIRDHLNEPPQVKMMDKASFTLGVGIITFAEYLIIKHPMYFTWFYTALMLLLFLLRFFMYKKAKYHFFMLDFCYITNLSCMLHANFFVENESWFKMNFAMSLGPICSAIIIWHNSLVFHSIEKLTSFFLHSFPPLMYHCYRFHVVKPDKMVISETASMYDIYALSLGMYLVWQIFYLIITEVIMRETLEEDPEIMTSLRYLSAAKKNPMNKAVTKMCRKINLLDSQEELDSENFKTKMVFLIIQLIYTLITLLPTYFLYKDYYLSCFFLITSFIVGTWNGGSYYIEVFSKRYNLKFEKEKPKESSSSSSTSNNSSESSSSTIERKDSGNQTVDHNQLETENEEEDIFAEAMEDLNLNESQAEQLLQILKEVEEVKAPEEEEQKSTEES